MVEKRARKGAAKPSARLAAERPKPAKKAARAAARGSTSIFGYLGSAAFGPGEQLGGAAPARYATASTPLRPTADKIRFKWICKSKSEVGVVAGDQVVTHYAVQLDAAYEPLSILDGQATVQGNLDNRAFGTGVPTAGISMLIASKAIADTFVVGRAYHSDFSGVEPAVRPLY